jgi:hypothetical protein
VEVTMYMLMRVVARELVEVDHDASYGEAQTCVQLSRSSLGPETGGGGPPVVT